MKNTLAHPVSSPPGSQASVAFWRSFLADPAVSAGLKVQAIEAALLPSCLLESSNGALAYVLEGWALHQAAQSKRLRQQAGGRPSKALDPLRWQACYLEETRSEREQPVLPVVRALVAMGAQVWGPGLSPLEMAFRLDLVECFKSMLSAPQAPASSDLEKLVSTPSGTWLEHAAQHACLDYLQALLSHGVEPTLAAATKCSRLESWRLLESAGLGATDPAFQSSVGWAWAQAGRPRLGLGDALGQGWLPASAWALQATPRYWMSINLHALLSGGKDLAQRFGSSAWTANAWERPGGQWRGRWSLPAVYALQALRHDPSVAGIGGLACWLANAPPNWEELYSLTGLPDRGWWALACWSELGRAPSTAPSTWKKVEAWALRGLGVSSWDDPGLVSDALKVTQGVAGSRRARRPILSRAWETWALELSSGLDPGCSGPGEGWVGALEALACPRLGLEMTGPLKEIARRRLEFMEALPKQSPASSLPIPLVRGVWACLALADASSPPSTLAGRRAWVDAWLGQCWSRDRSWPSDSPLPVQKRVVGLLEQLGHPKAREARAVFVEQVLEEKWGGGSGGAPMPSLLAQPRSRL